MSEHNKENKEMSNLPKNQEELDNMIKDIHKKHGISEDQLSAVSDDMRKLEEENYKEMVQKVKGLHEKHGISDEQYESASKDINDLMQKLHGAHHSHDGCCGGGCCDDDDCGCDDEGCGCKDGEECDCGDDCDCESSKDSCGCGSDKDSCCGGQCSCSHDESDADVEESEPVEKDLGELKETLQRLQAEFANYKNRTQEQMHKFATFANADLIKKILPVLDNFNLALKSKTQDDDFTKGVEMINSQLHKVLEEEGVVFIPASGKFDPKMHEAVDSVESDKEENTILEEVQKGYMLNDKVLRPAKVKISK